MSFFVCCEPVDHAPTENTDATLPFTEEQWHYHELYHGKRQEQPRRGELPKALQARRGQEPEAAPPPLPPPPELKVEEPVPAKIEEVVEEKVLEPVPVKQESPPPTPPAPRPKPKVDPEDVLLSGNLYKAEECGAPRLVMPVVIESKQSEPEDTGPPPKKQGWKINDALMVWEEQVAAKLGKSPKH